MKNCTTSSTNNSKSSARPRKPSHTKIPASFRHYLRDKLYFLLLAAIIGIIALLFLFGFHVRAEIIVMLTFFWLTFIISALLIEYFRKRSFYQDLLANISQLDQAYLVLETLTEPKFYDGEIIYAALYAINKSMAENINLYRTQVQEFQEYVEMWIHEVKTPLATLSLISRDPKINEQIKRLDDYVEQILYFARAENAERDYLIKKCNLEQIVGTVAGRNREILLAKKINFNVEELNQDVYTDSKWLEFILGQILNNSIKYQSSTVSISAHKTRDTRDTVLAITDNGVGIAAKDLPRVFDKSFTGDNGRIGKQSTGMGLYIAKILCDKLGHKISISSQPGKYTKVEITFADSKYYNVVDDATYKNVTNS